MSQERVNRLFQALAWLARIWNAILLAFSVFMIVFLASLLLSHPAYLGSILFGIGVFVFVSLLCISDLRGSPKSE